MSGQPQPIDTAGRPITGQALRRGLSCSILSSCFAQVWAAAANGLPLTMLLLALGANKQEQNMPAAIGQFVLCLQIFGALAAERLPTRKAFWFGNAFVHRMLWVIPAGLGFFLHGPSRLAVWVVLGILLVSGALAQFGTAAWHSWMADLIPGAQRGRFWGRRQMATMTVLLISYALTGWLLDYFHAPGPPAYAPAAAPAVDDAAATDPAAVWTYVAEAAAAPENAAAASGSREGRRPFFAFAAVFFIGALFGAADIVIHMLVPEPAPTPRPARLSLARRLLQPLRHRDFRLLTFSLGAWTFSLGVVGAFAAVYLRERYGASNFQLSLTSMAGALGAIPCGLLASYLIDRMGARIFGAVMMVLTMSAMTVWFFIPQGTWSFTLPVIGAVDMPAAVVFVIAASFVTGGAAAGVSLAQFSLLGEHSPREGRTMAMAVHWTTVGFLAVPGALLGGWLAEYFDKNPPVWTLPTGVPVHYIQILVAVQMTMALGVAVPLLLRVRGRGSELGLAGALSRLVIVNPMRLLGSVYNIYTLGSATGREDRAKAVRKLASLRTHVAAADLVRRLDDPSADVREAATFALSRIGGPEAIRALTAKLADPDSDLSAHAVRALREINDPRVVPALITVLDSPDREARAQAARALGRMRDPRAVPPLRKLLREAGRPVEKPASGGGGEASPAPPATVPRDEKLFASAAESLARLGDFDALSDILPWLRKLPDTVRMRGLAVAAGDLLGRRDHFYMLYAAEEESTGREAERRLARLTEQLRAEEARAGGLRLSRRRTTRRRGAEGMDDGARRAARFLSAYENGDYAAAAAVLHEILALVASLRWDVTRAAFVPPTPPPSPPSPSATAPSPVPAPDLAGHSAAPPADGTATAATAHILEAWSARGEQAARGAWYIAKLAHPDPGMRPPDRIEILLGLFFLDEWTEP